MQGGGDIKKKRPAMPNLPLACCPLLAVYHTNSQPAHLGAAYLRGTLRMQTHAADLHSTAISQTTLIVELFIAEFKDLLYASLSTDFQS
jgi:hypothetical protein